MLLKYKLLMIGLLLILSSTGFAKVKVIKIFFQIITNIKQIWKITNRRKDKKIVIILDVYLLENHVVLQMVISAFFIALNYYLLIFFHHSEGSCCRGFRCMSMKNLKDCTLTNRQFGCRCLNRELMGSLVRNLPSKIADDYVTITNTQHTDIKQ